MAAIAVLVLVLVVTPTGAVMVGPIGTAAGPGVLGQMSFGGAMWLTYMTRDARGSADR